MTTEEIKVTYTFEIEYEHQHHKREILAKLKEKPVMLSMDGAGCIDNKIYSYSCQRINKGVIANET